MAFEFRERIGHCGEYYYWPNNQEARELLDFMDSPWLIGEAKMDKIFDWMDKLGHEVVIEDQAQYIPLEEMPPWEDINEDRQYA